VPQPSLKEAIIDAGEAEFHDRGYAAAGIAGITSRASAPKGSFYNHFESKETLALEVLQRYADGQRLDILIDEARPPLDRIRDHFDFVAKRLSEDTHVRGCLLANFAAEVTDETQTLRRGVNEIHQGWVRAIVANLEAAAPTSARTFVPEDVAWALIDAYQGATVRTRASGSRAPIENFLSTTLPLVLSSIEAGSSDS
jgi:TetR/AcrR family transcriptional regulator, transcriptional repressor for nem operon